MTGSHEGRLGIGAHWPRRIILEICKYYAVFHLRKVAGSAAPVFPRAGIPNTHAPRADFQTAAREQFLVAEGFAAAMLL
jgi:hypothetical protein